MHNKFIKVLSFLLILLGVPVVLLIISGLDEGNYFIGGALVMVIAIAAFWMSFEKRKPQTREVVMLSVMCAVAVVGRAAFIMLPQFKPMTAIVMICGIYMGPQAGFIAGSVSVLASNFIFGQGPWTPWQMFAIGLMGFIAGLLAKKGIMDGDKPLVTGIVGGTLVLVLAGPLLDTCTLFMMSSMVNTQSALAVYGAGLPFNAIHALATFIVLLLLVRPIGEKLQRLRKKYGIMER